MNVLCVIPARSGSQRIPRKNWQEIDGQSLVMHAHTAAVASGVCDRIVVSSDSPEWPVPEVINRPEHLSRGEPDSLSRTVQHALQQCERGGVEYDLVVTLQPATPLRSPTLIREMVTNTMKFRTKGAITMAKTVPWTWQINGSGAVNSWFPHPYPRSQDCNFQALQEINTVQIGDRESVLQGKRWGLPLLVTEMPSWATLDIDTPGDLEESRRLWRPLRAEMDAITDFPHHVVYSINGVNEQ